jgi:diguanylate cyclase (GGDEF)-like protein
MKTIEKSLAALEHGTGAARNTVLIADDDRIITTKLAQILRADYSIYVANDGKDAVKSANVLLPDVIMLDILMPGLNGFDVIHILKKTKETHDIPVIVISGLSNPKDEERALYLGAADYISKPFSPEIVKLRVKNQVRIVNQIRIIEQLSVTDALTNMANRRQFNIWLEREWRKSLRGKTPLSLLLIDVDRFKVFNDTYGHIQGDIILQAIAAIISHTVKRPGDLVARWGGEEFAVLLPATDAEGAYIVAELIRTSIEEYDFCLEDGDTAVNVTISIGLNCNIPEAHTSITRFIADADKALYYSKANGRNMVSVAEPAPAPSLRV